MSSKKGGELKGQPQHLEEDINEPEKKDNPITYLDIERGI